MTTLSLTLNQHVRNSVWIKIFFPVTLIHVTCPGCTKGIKDMDNVSPSSFLSQGLWQTFKGSQSELWNHQWLTSTEAASPVMLSQVCFLQLCLYTCSSLPFSRVNLPTAPMTFFSCVCSESQNNLSVLRRSLMLVYFSAHSVAHL